MKKSTIMLILLLMSISLSAQYQIGLIPRVSPDKAVFQKIGYTEIEIKYGSPSVKNRDIWGDLVPYHKVWRAGANNATTIEFNTDVIIGNKKLEKGKYSFFILPQEDKKWIAIFNKESDQWGAFDYDKEKDALRVAIIPKPRNEFKEKLEYAIHNYGFQYGVLKLEWEFLEIQIEVDTDYFTQFKNEIESRVEKAEQHIQWVIYLQGAEHLERVDANLDLAEHWINKSETLYSKDGDWNKQYYPKSYIEGHLYWTKAKLLAKRGDYKSALEYAEKMKQADEKSMFYNRKQESEKIDLLINDWKK